MRHGFTTGSCAAAAAKAAAEMLLLGTKRESIRIFTPKGIVYEPEIVDVERGDGFVSCAVIKDGGDDPDRTTGLKICACVRILCEPESMSESTPENGPESVPENKPESGFEGVPEEGNTEADESQRENAFEEDSEAVIEIDGGEGVGRVTKPGLDQPVGSAAINHVPREMITKEVREVCMEADFHGILSVVISVPGGEEIARETFNPRLGIVGGISIIGTSGIVEPMSTQALLDTILVELRQTYAEGQKIAAVSPGNYGLDYMKRTYGYDLDRSVKCSNFIGDTIDMAAELGFSGLLLTGNLGKLVKVAGGIMNTHSREGDCRMEILAAAALQEGVPTETVLAILDCVVTDEAVRLLEESGKRDAVMGRLLEKILFYLRKRAAGRLDIECILYSSQFGELAKSEGAEKWLTLLVQDPAQPI